MKTALATIPRQRRFSINEANVRSIAPEATGASAVLFGEHRGLNKVPGLRHLAKTPRNIASETRKLYNRIRGTTDTRPRVPGFLHRTVMGTNNNAIAYMKTKKLLERQKRGGSVRKTRRRHIKSHRKHS